MGNVTGKCFTAALTRSKRLLKQDGTKSGLLSPELLEDSFTP